MAFSIQENLYSWTSHVFHAQGSKAQQHCGTLLYVGIPAEGLTEKLLHGNDYFVFQDNSVVRFSDLVLQSCMFLGFSLTCDLGKT